jgi:hypothetical protein
VTCAAKPIDASRPRIAVDANGNPARLITIPTAAGIDVTVAPLFARSIQGFIADAVADIGRSESSAILGAVATYVVRFISAGKPPTSISMAGAKQIASCITWALLRRSGVCETAARLETAAISIRGGR